MADLDWPADLGSTRLEGRLLYLEGDTSDSDRDPDITPVTSGTVTVEPSVKEVRYEGALGSAILIKKVTQGVIDSQGFVCTLGPYGRVGERGLVIPAADSEKLTPRNFTYKITIRVKSEGWTSTYSINARAGETVDLAKATPVATSGGTAIVVDASTATRAETAAALAEQAAIEAQNYKPSFFWDESRLIIDGAYGPDLRGPSTDLTAVNSKIDEVSFLRPVPISGTDFNDITKPGTYPIIFTNHPNQPFSATGFLTVESNGASRRLQTFKTNAEVPLHAERITSVSGWWGWQFPREAILTKASLYADQAAKSNPLPWEHYVRHEDMRRRRFNRVTTPGVVSLVFDHGLTKFKSDILPLLQARSLPVTLAINPGQMAQTQNAGASYADVKSWASAGIVEPANHSYNHTGGSNSTQYAHEIIGSRVELENQIGQTIDTWVHPGNIFGEFTVDGTLSHYWATEAGRLILSAHGAVTGMVASGSLPVGRDLIGAGGIWIDSSGSIPGTQTAISQSIAEKGLRIIRLHPQFLNDSGKLTTSELTAFLDWLVLERSSGRLSVLTFRDALSAEHTPGSGWVDLPLRTGVTGLIQVRRDPSGTVHCRGTSVLPPQGLYPTVLADIGVGYRPQEHFFWAAEEDTQSWHKLGIYNAAANSESNQISWLRGPAETTTRPTTPISWNTIWATDDV